MLRVVMMTKIAWWVNEEVNRDKTGEGEKMNLKLIPKMRWCTSRHLTHKRPVTFNEMVGGWARKGYNRWGVGTAREPKRDQVVNIPRLTLIQCWDLSMGVISVDLTTARARVLNLLKPVKLTLDSLKGCDKESYSNQVQRGW